MKIGGDVSSGRWLKGAALVLALVIVSRPATACFVTPDSRPLIGCMPFNFSTPMDWIGFEAGRDDAKRPEVFCYARSAARHVRLIERLYGQMRRGEAANAFASGSKGPDLNGDSPFDFGAVQNIKEFTPEFVRAYYPPLFALIRDFETCMTGIAEQGCGGVADCRIHGFVWMGYLPDGSQYPVVGMPDLDDPCEDMTDPAARNCPDPLWEAVHPDRPLSAPIPSRKPVFDGPPIPSRKPAPPSRESASAPELTIVGDVGMMAKPSFQQAWIEAFQLRLAQHYRIMATHGEDAAAFTLMGSVIDGLGEVGPKRLRSYIQGSKDLDVLIPTLQEGRRVILDDPDLTDGEVVLLRVTEGILQLVAEIMVEKGLNQTAAKILKHGMSAYVVNAAGGLMMELSWQAGTVGSIAYFAYEDAIAAMQAEQIPADLKDDIEARVLPLCRGGHASIPGFALYSPRRNEVAVRLGLVDCDWYPEVAPCIYGVGCIVLRFQREAGGWTPLPHLNSDKIGDVMMVGRTRPYEKPDVPPPPEVAADPLYKEIYDLKDAPAGRGADLDSE